MTRPAHDSTDRAPTEDLRQRIAKRQVVAFVGAGVSMAATRGAATASWKGLLHSGIAHCESFVAKLPSGWGQRQRDALDAGDLDEMLTVAEQVTKRLRAPDSGEYAGWLRAALDPSALPLHDDAVLRSLDALQVPIVTTNYDDLIERATGLPGVTWREKHKLTRLIRGEDRAVLHLHGKWDAPDSVILGIRDYEAVKNDEHTQAVLQTLGFAHCLLFVGCGEGLNDPNFTTFMQWLSRVKASDEYRSYRLALRSEVAALQDEHPPEQRIFVLPYGENFSDLAGFLAQLQPAESAAPRPVATSLSPAWDAYLRRLCEEHARLPLIGLAAALQVDLPIDETYVPLRTCYTPTSAERGRFDLAAFREAEQLERDVRLEDVFRCAARTEHRGVLLLGEPGAGKTTGARQLCWRLASGRDGPDGLALPAGTLPVFLRLRNLPSGSDNQGLRAFVQAEAQVAADGGPPVAAGPELWDHRGSLLWMFDGLDEVVDETARRQVGAWIAELLERRTQDRILVTGRYQGVEGKVDLGPAFVRFEVQPLDDMQADRFVHTWFRVVYDRLGLDREAATDKSRSLVKMLGERSYDVERLGELRRNPLLLTILCVVYHEDSSLPRSRVRLYERCVKVLLETWHHQVHVQRGGRPYNPDAARQVLASVAWWMQNKADRRSVPLADMEARAADELRRYPNSGLGTDGREFIRLMREDSGIIAASGAGYAEFLHLTFQEYLAALYAVRDNQSQTLAGLVSQSWWQEVILLALAQGTPAFSDGFFQSLLTGETLEQQGGFVERCLAESEPLIVEPFLRQLRAARTKQRRKVALLRHLRAYPSPELADICRDWTDSPNKELASLSREILQRSAAMPEAAVAEIAPAEFVDPQTGIAFVRIAAGTFQMGDERWQWAKPIHAVRITQDFYLGKYPVTNEEYARFLLATGHAEPREWNERRFNQPRQPVVGVSWDDAQAFCQWAGCRLPTDAEWEYACRAGTTTAFSFGDEEDRLGEFAWYDKNSDKQTQPVGGKQANPWGLYDMHGNVYEWCQDWFDEDYYRSSPPDDPPGPTKGKPLSIWPEDIKREWGDPRVLRGGCWNNDGENCRSGYRNANEPAKRNRRVGFRVLRAR